MALRAAIRRTKSFDMRSPTQAAYARRRKNAAVRWQRKRAWETLERWEEGNSGKSPSETFVAAQRMASSSS